MDFANKTVLVTGGAGTLGAAVAQTFLERGATVVLLDRHATLAQSERFSPAQRVRYLSADLLNPADLERALGQLQGGAASIDVLCNIAGAFSMGPPVHASSAADWERMFDLNLRTALNAVRAIAPAMVARGSGKIINIGAMSAARGMGGMAAYGAAKSALLRASEAMADELAPSGVNVNAVLPSIIDTPQNRADMPQADPTRWASPREVADVIAFLASDAARGVRGAAIPVVGRG